MLASTVLAGGDIKEAAKSKRAYSLGYGYSPYTYFDHDVLDPAPVAAVHHAPIAAAYHAPVAAYHAPIVSHAPIVAAPVISAVAPVSRVTSSVVSTNVHHYPASYYAPPARYVSSAPYYSAYHAPAALVAPAYAPSPYAPSALLAAYHRR